ncbi:MAG: T9SS type A sorting domain-containing protein [Bacteroidetes bacterium]|nr:T9SS type A sorting domain-containing protein [Bacteroidota bacterium]
MAGETNQTYTATANGNFSVIVTSGTCSVDTSDCISVNSIGLTNTSFSSSIKVFPNPNNGNFTIDLGSIEESVSVKITDVLGKQISVENFSRSKNLNINLNEPAGVYFVTITNKDNKFARIKVVKQ